MNRIEEMENLGKQMLQKNKNSVSRLKMVLQKWSASGELTPEEIAKFRYEIAETEKAIEELEEFLNEKDLA